MEPISTTSTQAGAFQAAEALLASPAAAAPGERLISSSLGGAGSEPVRVDPAAPSSDALSGALLAPPPVPLKREPASTTGASSPPRRKIA